MSSSRPAFRRGQVWIVDLADRDQRGHEQSGRRRAVILQADQLLGAPESIWTIIMVPFTTQKLERAVLPTHHRVTSCGPGTPFTEPSMAMCHQVRALDSVRFRDYLGMLGGDDFKQIIAGVLYSIGLKMKQ